MTDTTPTPSAPVPPDEFTVITECTPQQVVDFLYLEACRDVLDGYPQQQTALTLRWVAGYIQEQYGLSSEGNTND